MPALPFPPSADSDWAAEITADAVEFMDGKISVFDPSDIIETPYNAETDTGGTTSQAPVIIDRPARIVPIGAPKEAATSSEWNVKQFFRIQIELEPDDPILTRGLLLRVVDGSKDKTLERYAFTVFSSVNSSAAPLRTIVCASPMLPTPLAPGQ